MDLLHIFMGSNAVASLMQGTRDLSTCGLGCTDYAWFLSISLFSAYKKRWLVALVAHLRRIIQQFFAHCFRSPVVTLNHGIFICRLGSC
jgi:hypothetical protein